MISLEYGKGLIDEERTGEGYPVVGSNGIVGYHDEYLIEAPCIVVGRKGSAGEITFLEQPCYPIDTTFYVKPKNDFFNIKFLAYLLRLLKLQRLALFKGVPGLNRYDAYEAKIPLIQKECQNKILGKIEPIEREIQRLQETISDPTEAISRVFAREFGIDIEGIKENLKQKFFTISSEQLAQYRSLRMDFKHHLNMPLFNQVIEQIGAYKSLAEISLEAPAYGANEPGIDGEPDVDIRYIRITDIDDLGNLIADEWKTVENVESQYLLENDDFLFARSGNTVGKTFLYNSEKHPESLFAGYFIKYKLDFSEILPLYLLYYTKSFIFTLWKHGTVRIKGQPNINAEEYLELKIPHISITQQEKIITEVQSELSAQDEINRRIEAMRTEIDVIIEQALS